MAYEKVTKLAVDDKLLDLSDYAKKTDIINMVAPVGHVMIRVDNINPGTLPGYEGTSWQKISEGRMLVGANSQFTLGSTGGQANPTLPQHSHGGSVSVGAHPAMTLTGGAHTHAGNYRTTTVQSGTTRAIRMALYPPGTADTIAQSVGNAVTSVNLPALGHSASVSIGNAGTNDLTNKNYPPYLAVNMWVRRS